MVTLLLFYFNLNILNQGLTNFFLEGGGSRLPLHTMALVLQLTTPRELNLRRIPLSIRAMSAKINYQSSPYCTLKF